MVLKLLKASTCTRQIGKEQNWRNSYPRQKSPKWLESRAQASRAPGCPIRVLHHTLAHYATKSHAPAWRFKMLMRHVIQDKVT